MSAQVKPQIRDSRPLNYAERRRAGPEVIALVLRGLHSKTPAGKVTAGERLRNHDCSVDHASPFAGAPQAETPPAPSCAGAGTAAGR